MRACRWTPGARFDWWDDAVAHAWAMAASTGRRWTVSRCPLGTGEWVAMERGFKVA